MPTNDLTILLFLLLSLIPISQIPLSDPNSRPVTETRNYIVRFLNYEIAANHKSYLEENLKNLREKWKWIERKNPAMNFPTDFGVLEIGEKSKEILVEIIERLGNVKDVQIDSSYGRNLFEDENYDMFNGEKKRKGKLFTSMSFEEEGEKIDKNDSVGWKRRILTEVMVLIFNYK